MTDTLREAARLSDAMVRALGREVRESRRRLRLTQADLALRVGVHQTWISDIELGRGHGAPLELWVAIGVAIRRPLAVSLTKAIEPETTLLDAGHLEMQESLLGLAARNGRRATIERPSNPREPRHSTDVAIFDDPRRILILVEAWNTFRDLGAAIRSTHRKEAEAAERAAVTADAGSPLRIATVWVVRATAANREILARYPHLFAATFDGSSRGWVRALTDGDVPPERPGLVWFDTSTARITEWRRR